MLHYMTCYDRYFFLSQILFCSYEEEMHVAYTKHALELDLFIFLSVQSFRQDLVIISRYFSYFWFKQYVLTPQ